MKPGGGGLRSPRPEQAGERDDGVAAALGCRRDVRQVVDGDERGEVGGGGGRREPGGHESVQPRGLHPDQGQECQP
ncbi:hypothetical protein [Rhodococcus qingshengii]|uniref:hypothetical protein n=1 Tax=Rhodococcus qingshengii TaxID=334542 RepID=UPI0030178ED8